MPKTPKNYRLNNTLIDKLKDSVKELNEHTGYKSYTETKVLERLIAEYLPKLTELLKEGE